MIVIQPLASVDHAAVETLLDAAFGPGRHARTAYAIRGRARALPALSFAALDGTMLAGSIQCWAVGLSLDGGGTAPLSMVGPVAVMPDRQGGGIGRLLMETTLDAAGEGVGRGLMLIGDPEYYTRFGFTAARTARWRLPGPVDARRLLARGDVPDAAGLLGPA